LHGIPVSSRVEIVFDANYDLSGASLATPDGTLSVSGNTVSLSLSEAVPVSSALNLRIIDVVNPGYSQATDSFSVTVKDSNGNTVDRGEHAGIAILPAQVGFVTPAAGDVYSVGDTKTIKWQVVHGNLARGSSHWSVQFSADEGFTSPISVHEGLASVDADNNMYFTLSVDSSMLAETAYLRVSCIDTNYTDVTSTSGQFSIRPAAGFARFVSPTADSKWAIGSESLIEWATQGAVSNNFKIEYYSQGAWTTVYQEGVSGSGGVSKSAGDEWFEDSWAYSWTVPQAANLPDTGVRIRITNVDNSIISGSSDSFEISTAYIKITSPEEGVTWVRNETNSITWEGYGSSGTNFSIQYTDSANEIERQIYSGEISRSYSEGKWLYSYSWDVDIDLEPTDSATLTITNLDNEEIKDTSAAFNVKASGKLEITAPAEGDKWVVGAKYTIKWTSEGQALGSSSLRITYTADGITETLVTNSTANSGSKDFTCPATALDNVKVHIYQISGDFPSDPVRSGSWRFLPFSSYHRLPMTH